MVRFQYVLCRAVGILCDTVICAHTLVSSDDTEFDFYTIGFRCLLVYNINGEIMLPLMGTFKTIPR